MKRIHPYGVTPGSFTSCQSYFLCSSTSTPLGTILGVSLAPEGKLELEPLRSLVSSSYYLRTLWFTFWQAAVSTLLVLLLAIPGAYVFARYRFRGKRTLRQLIMLPFVLPTIVVANAFLALLGPGGTVNSLLMDLFQLSQPPLQLQHTIWMILLAHIFFNYSVALRIISNSWQNLSPDLSQAAQMLGASPGRAFLHITLPLLRPSVLAAACPCFYLLFYQLWRDPDPRRSPLCHTRSRNISPGRKFV